MEEGFDLSGRTLEQLASDLSEFNFRISSVLVPSVKKQKNVTIVLPGHGRKFHDKSLDFMGDLRPPIVEFPSEGYFADASFLCPAVNCGFPMVPNSLKCQSTCSLKCQVTWNQMRGIQPRVPVRSTDDQDRLPSI